MIAEVSHSKEMLSSVNGLSYQRVLLCRSHYSLFQRPQNGKITRFQSNKANNNCEYTFSQRNPKRTVELKEIEGLLVDGKH